MMLWLIFLFYICTIFLIAFFIRKFRPRNSQHFFDPQNFFILMLFAETPFLLSVVIDQSILDQRYILAGSFDYLFLQFTVTKVFFAITFLCICTFFSNKHDTTEFSKSIPLKNYFLYGVIFLVMGIFVTSVLVTKVGGLEIILTSWSVKTETVRGTAFLRFSMMIFFAMSVLCFYFDLAKLNTSNFFKSIFLFLSIVLGFVCLGLFGERKAPLLLIAVLLVAIKFISPQISFFRARYFFLGFAILVFSSIAPVMRKPENIEYFISGDFMQIYIGMLESSTQIFINFSDFPVSVLVFGMVNDVSELWHFRTISDFFYGFIPSSFYSQKPPLDEGVYIYNLAQGNSVTLGSAFNDMIPVGWPLSRINGPYLHLWYPGVILGAVFSAGVTVFLYNRVVKNLNPPLLFLYSMVCVTSFGLTNAHIFSLITHIIILGPLFFLFRKTNRI
jgi:hypothetical protein